MNKKTAAEIAKELQDLDTLGAMYRQSRSGTHEGEEAKKLFEKMCAKKGIPPEKVKLYVWRTSKTGIKFRDGVEARRKAANSQPQQKGQRNAPKTRPNPGTIKRQPRMTKSPYGLGWLDKKLDKIAVWMDKKYGKEFRTRKLKMATAGLCVGTLTLAVASRGLGVFSFLYDLANPEQTELNDGWDDSTGKPRSGVLPRKKHSAPVRKKR